MKKKIGRKKKRERERERERGNEKEINNLNNLSWNEKRKKKKWVKVKIRNHDQRTLKFHSLPPFSTYLHKTKINLASIFFKKKGVDS